MKKHREFISSGRYQQGATLIVALVILLVMSVVGVASMSSSNLQARMASNDRQQLMSMYAAESGLRAARLFIEKMDSDELYKFKQKAEGLYSATSDLVQALPSPSVSVELNFPDFDVGENWNDDNSVEVVDVDDKLLGNVKSARYFIEYLGVERLGLSVIDPNSDGVDLSPRFYRIVAIGWGQDPQIYSIIQASYRSAESL